MDKVRCSALHSFFLFFLPLIEPFLLPSLLSFLPLFLPLTFPHFLSPIYPLTLPAGHRHESDQLTLPPKAASRNIHHEG
jgi:hypothetical protein